MENLGIDGKLLLAQIVNFTIFFLVFRKFIAKPFLKFLDSEKKKEVETEKRREEIEKQHQKILDEEAKWRHDLTEERTKTLAETKKMAEEIRQDTLAQTKKEADDLLAKAKKQIEDEKKALYDEVRGKTIDLSMYIIRNGLREYLTEDVQKKLTDYIIKNLGKKVEQYEN